MIMLSTGATARGIKTACLILAFAWAAPARAASPVVVELFTSEGCSSCPPADAFLSELADRPDLVPLDFHVTYWNRLGWKDPFSLDASTARQDRYASLFGETEVYTPEMVINGRTDVVGSDRRAALARIALEKASVSAAPVTLRLDRAGTGLKIFVDAGSGSGSLVLVGFDPSHDTPIGGGENSGRLLHEANVVRSVSTIGRWNGSPITIDVQAPAGRKAALLLQADDGHILAAAVAG